MQHIRELVFYLFGAGAPVKWGLKPVSPVGEECPRPYMGNSGGEGINPAFQVFGVTELFGKPVFIDETLAGMKVRDDPHHQMGMFGGRDVAIVWNLAGFPRAHDLCRRFHQLQNI